MYAVTSFKGVILQETVKGEQDASFVIYTEDLGKIYVQAKSIKKTTAKHGMNMQPLSLVTIDVVRGLGGWRLIGSSLEKSFSPKDTFVVRALLGRVIRIILDLTPIEQAEVRLFELLCFFLDQNLSDLSDKTLIYMESRMVARVLDVLGWWKGGDISAEAGPDIISPKDFVNIVNQGLEAAYD